MESELAPYLTGKYSIEDKQGKLFYHLKISNKEVILAFSGIGKVNASYTTSLIIHNYQPDIIISTGVSGGLGQSDLMQFVVASATCQHDFDTSALGDELGMIGTINVKYFPTDKVISQLFIKDANAKYGVVACGDQFICNKEKAKQISTDFNAIACDMESGAIGQVCYMAKVPYVVVRCISDSADDNATMDFNTLVIKASKLLSSKVIETIKTLSIDKLGD